MTERQKHICFKSWFCLVYREQGNCVVKLSQEKKKNIKRKKKREFQGDLWSGLDMTERIQ